MKTIEEKIAIIEENLLSAFNALNKLKEEVNATEQEPQQEEVVEDEELFDSNNLFNDFFGDSKEETKEEIIELSNSDFTPLKFDLNAIDSDLDNIEELSDNKVEFEPTIEIEVHEEGTIEEFIDDFFVKSSMILSIHQDEIVNIYRKAIEFNDDRLSVAISLLEKIAEKREIALPSITIKVEDKEEPKEEEEREDKTLYNTYYSILVDKYKEGNKSRATKKAVGLYALNNQKGYPFLTTTLSSRATGQELVDLAVSNYAIIRGIEKLVNKENYNPFKFNLDDIIIEKKDEVIVTPKSIEEKELTPTPSISDDLTDKLNELEEVASKFDLDPKAILQALLSTNPRGAVSMDLKIGFFNVAGFSKYAKDLLEILESEESPDIEVKKKPRILDTIEEFGIEVSEDLTRLISVSHGASISPMVALGGETEDEDLNRYINLVFAGKKERLHEEFDKLKKTIKRRRLEEV